MGEPKAPQGPLLEPPARSRLNSAEPDAAGMGPASEDRFALQSQLGDAHNYQFHCAGDVYIPFTKRQARRMEVRHRLMRLCLEGELTLTRLDPEEIKVMIDVGTGTGLWPTHMAARFPGARIIGMDVAPIQGTLVPPNVTYQIGNVEEPWDIEDASVDFIHVRSMIGVIHDWPAMLAQAYRKLRPGGLLELTEISTKVNDFDGKFGECQLLPRTTRLHHAVTERKGTDYDPIPKFTRWLHETRFERVSQRMEILPLWPWTNDEKLIARSEPIRELMECWLVTNADLMFEELGRDRSEIDAETEEFREEFLGSKYKTYMTAYFTTARKPHRS